LNDWGCLSTPGLTRPIGLKVAAPGQGKDDQSGPGAGQQGNSQSPGGSGPKHQPGGRLRLPIILCRPGQKGPSQSRLGPFFFPIPSKPYLKGIFVLRNTLFFFPKYMVPPIFFGNILSKYGLWGAKFYGLKVHSLFSHRSDYCVFRYSLSWRLCV